MQAPSADFTDDELAIVRAYLRERYRDDVPVHLADCEISVDGGEAACATVFWRARGANFVVFKVDRDRFRGQFLYTPHDHYGVGRREFTELDECVATLLQIQADDERQSSGVGSAVTGADLRGQGEGSFPAFDAGETDGRNRT